MLFRRKERLYSFFWIGNSILGYQVSHLASAVADPDPAGSPRRHRGEPCCRFARHARGRCADPDRRRTIVDHHGLLLVHASGGEVKISAVPQIHCLAVSAAFADREPAAVDALVRDRYVWKMSA
jgi:hypothetical protein